jgi:hypothetical protein
MIKRSLLCVAAMLFMVSFGRSADQGTWKGYVSDDKCGVKGTEGSSAALAECANKCVKERGAKYALYDPNSKKVYVLDPQDKVAPHAGHFVSVKGTLEGDTIHVTSLTMAKAAN